MVMFNITRGYLRWLPHGPPLRVASCNAEVQVDGTEEQRDFILGVRTWSEDLLEGKILGLDPPKVPDWKPEKVVYMTSKGKKNMDFVDLQSQTGDVLKVFECWAEGKAT